MARIRSLKPEMWSSESIGRLSRNARLLFVALITQVDDAGRIRASSRGLASLLFPFDDDASTEIDGWIGELETAGMFRRYMADGSTFGEIPKFTVHQKIDHPSESKLPAFTEPLANPREASRILAPDQGSRIKDQGVDQDQDQDHSSTLAVALVVKPARKTPEAIGPEIPTSNGPWRLTIGAARKRMTAYGMTETQMVDILDRIAKHYAGLPSNKLPGAAGMSSILDKWLIKHGPGCAATETAPRGSVIAAADMDYIIALQNEIFPRASA